MNNYKNHFIYINNIKCECKACGILPFTIIENKLYFLLQKDKKNIYSDFGGKRELYDTDYIKTASREFAEETNGFFFNINEKLINNSNEKLINNNIKKSAIIIDSIIRYNKPLYLYNYIGKYLIYLLEIPAMNPANLGKYEINNINNCYRSCNWIEYNKLLNNNFIKNNISFRLKKGIIHIINKLLIKLKKENIIIIN